MADLAAIIPTLGNDLPMVQRAIDAVLASRTSLAVEVIVVVNARFDPFARVGMDLPARVRILVAGVNLGWAGGLLAGRVATSAHTLWLVQDDMEPDPACLDALIAALDAEGGADLVGPLTVVEPVVNEGGNIIDGIVAKHSLGGRLNPAVFSATKPFDGSEPIVVDRQPPADARLVGFVLPPVNDYIPSRGMMLRASTWDAAGGMDARFYPVGSTDVDFCRAISEAGMRFATVPAARMTHVGSASTARSLARVVFQRNRHRVVDKWRDGERSASFISPAVPDAVRDAVLVGATEAVRSLAEELERVTQQRDHLRERVRAQRGVSWPTESDGR